MRKNSRRKALLLAANATLLGGFCGSHALATSYTWTTTFATGAVDQTWTNTGNWSGNVVPGQNDAAIFKDGLVPPSATVVIPSDQSIGAILDPMANTSALTINAPSSGSITLTMYGQSTSQSQAGTLFTGSNVVLSATGLTPAGAKNLTIGSSSNFVNLALVNSQNIILGTNGATSGNSQGNVIQINGNISDATATPASITMLGNGNFGREGAVLDLRGSNTFSGGLTIGSADGLNGAQVRVTDASNLGTGPVNINWNGQLLFNQNGIYGTGQTMFVNGTGLLNNTGNSGAWRTGAASIIWNGDMSIGSTNLSENTLGQVVLSSTGTNVFELHGKLTGTGSLQKQGGGTFLLSGTNNDCTGNTQIGNGVLTVAAGSSMSTGDLVMFQSSSNTGVSLNLYNATQNIGNLSSNFTQTSGSFFQFINIGSNSIGGVLNIKQTQNKSYGYGNAQGLTSTIVGPGGISLDQNSTAALTFTGGNSYQGGTTINGGTLNLANPSDGSSAVGSGSVVVNQGGHLSTGGNITVLGQVITDGTMGGTLQVNSGGVIAPGNDSLVGTLTVGTLDARNGSQFNFDVVGGNVATTDKIIVNNALTLAVAGQETINIADTSVATGQFTLMTYPTANNSATEKFTFSNGSETFSAATAVGGTRTYTLATTASAVTLTIADTSQTRFWSIGGGTGPADGGGVWTANTSVSDTNPNFFASNPDHPQAAYLNADNSSVVIGNGQAGGLITLGSNIRVGGLLAIATSSSPYTIGAPGDTHTLTLAKGVSAQSNATIQAPVVMEQSGTFSPQSGAVLAVTGGISESVAGETLTKTGLGTMALGGTNTYTGGTVISAGVLQSTSSSLPSVPAANAVTNNKGLVFANTADGTFAGVISGVGTVGVNAPMATTVLTLTGSNSYSGATVLQNGVLAISSPNNIGTGFGGIKFSGGTLKLNANVSIPATFSAANLVSGTTTTIDTNTRTLTLNNILNGGGNLTKIGAGSLIIAGIHTTDNIGTVGISAGTISLAPSSVVSYGFSADPNGNTFQGDLVISKSMELRLQGGTISGGGTVRIVPSGMLVVAKVSTAINNNIVLNDGLVGGYSAQFGAASLNTLTLGAPISGRGDVVFQGGAGTVILNAKNTYTANTGLPLTTTVNNDAGGGVQLGINDALPTATALHMSANGLFDMDGFNQTVASIDSSANNTQVQNNGTGTSILTINGNVNSTYNGFLFDGSQGVVALNLASTNTGSLTLTATNTYSGGTTLNGGTLIVSKNVNLGADTGSLTFNGGKLVTNSINMIRPVTIGANGGTIDIAATSTASIGGAGTTSWAGGTLFTTNSGTLALARVGASILVVPGSTLNVGTASSVTVDATQDPFTDSNTTGNHVAIVNNGVFSVTAGSSTIARHTGSGALIVNGGGVLALAASAPGSSASSVTVDLPSSSKLDLANNGFVVNYTGASPDASIRAALVSGSTITGSWDGPGINSSTAHAVFLDGSNTHKTAIGYAEASQVSLVSPFFTQPFDSTSILLRYTLLGDANLDGKVNALDFNAVSANYSNVSGKEWVQADFNYDGMTNTLDFNALATNFNLSLGAPASGLGSLVSAPSLGSLVSAPSLGTLVPEPIAMPMLIAGAALLARRKRANRA